MNEAAGIHEHSRGRQEVREHDWGHQVVCRHAMEDNKTERGFQGVHEHGRGHLGGL